MRLLCAPAIRGRPGDPVRLRDGVPRRVADVLRTATARRPENRYPDAAAFAAALDRATVGRSRAGPAALAAGRAAMGLASLAVIAVLASDSVLGRFVERPGVAVDTTARMSINLPDGWRAVTGPWEASSAGGHGGSAMELSPDPARWQADTAIPGAFVGLSRTGDVTPAEFLARHRNSGCVAAPMRTTREADLDWLITGFLDCPDGRAEIVQAVGTRPGVPGMVYVQVAPPANSTPTFVDTLLAGVRVR
jgi:hypothetical protein